jgi:hypothetical protein
MCRTPIARLILMVLAVSAAGVGRPARAEILYTAQPQHCVRTRGGIIR